MTVSPDVKDMHLRARFVQVFGAGPCRVFRAPGRVNLIGEHTDYNEGLVLPIAVGLSVRVGVRVRRDKRMRIVADNIGRDHETEIGATGATEEAPLWARYIIGTVELLRQGGMNVPGLDLLVIGDIPIGAGLGSSAALTVAVAKAVLGLLNVDLPPVDIARLCQEVESRYAGVRCGLMDQLCALLGRRGHAVLIDCRDLASTLVPFPEKIVSLVVCDTTKRRALAASAYNQRREECRQAVELLRETGWDGRTLRDLTEDDLRRYGSRLPEVLYRRAEHVLGENRRVLEAREALVRGDVRRFGELLDHSHRSLCDLYEVGGSELDAMVQEARRVQSCLGARMTGAGFAGCAIAVVGKGSEQEFCAQLESSYRRRTGLPGRVFTVCSADGAREVD